MNKRWIIRKRKKTKSFYCFDKFLLDKNSKKEDIDFEIEFLIDKVKYKYFLRLNENEILKEKLSYSSKGKEEVIINRQITKWQIEEKYFWFKDEDFEKVWLSPRHNQTFISLLADRDSRWKFLATKIIKFFRWINFIDSRFDLTWLTSFMIKDEAKKRTIFNFIRNADINIEDIKQEERELNEDNDFIIMKNGQRLIPNKVLELNFVHPVYQNQKSLKYMI